MKTSNGIQKNKGMTYVELIVVLSIFAVMSAVTLFDYGKFEAQVDIKNLANDIALKIVGAQKNAMSGKWNLNASTGWKPSYGLFFSTSTSIAKKSFTSFVDLDPRDNQYTVSSICPSGECLEKININKNDFILEIKVFYQGGATANTVKDFTVTFTRPDSIPKFVLNPNGTAVVDYVQLTISSPQVITSKVKIYSSGRVQIN